LIVDELDVLPVDAFVVVLLLFELEDVPHEELLQVLVGKIDAELFEAIVVEVLEAEDVQDSDRISLALSRSVYRAVDLLHDEDEHSAVDAFDEGVSDVDALFARQSRHHCLSVGEESLPGEGIDQGLRGHSQQVRHSMDVRRVGDFRGVQIVDDRRFVFDVADVEKRRQELHDLPDLLVREEEDFHGAADVGEFRGVVSTLARDTTPLKFTL
jgi:hypothetical protein